MTLRLVGAGVGRTGTTSLQNALEMLLGDRCYHMGEVFPRPDHMSVWHEAALGRMPDWAEFLSDYVAAVDWPPAAFWEELAAAFPDALILLSTRRDGETWWRSASETIFPATIQANDSPWRRMTMAMLGHRFTPDFENKDAAIAAYEAHNAHVRATAPASRLLEWQVEDGWEPLCAALAVPLPDLPFPHENPSEDFQVRIGPDDPAPKT
jgi:hypothetical protein